MIRIQDIRLPLHHAPEDLPAAIAARLQVAPEQLKAYRVWRRAYDARRKSDIVFTYTVDCDVDEPAAVLQRLAKDVQIKPTPDTLYRVPGHAGANDAPKLSSPHRPVVIGFGPCGIFAALILAQMGLRPIVLERGKAVRERTADTWDLWRRKNLHPESNVQFGEGGAGTFSDGKLWSQISDPRHLTRKVLSEFVKAGAPEEIMWVSKPHIGTFRLVSMVEKIRADIVALGGEIRFQHRLEDVHIEGGRLQGLTVLDQASGQRQDILTHHAVLAVGHSARDTFAMLFERGVPMVAKPFSMGFRIEHPQSIIDKARFGRFAGDPLLGAADYKLVHHASNGRSVYSFCMCPGGTVVAATSEAGQVVTNGMSQYSRAERNANAGIVVGIQPQDYRQDGRQDGPVHPLDGMAFQRIWERRAWELGGRSYEAPGQRLADFLKNQPSTALGSVQPSYRPGVHLTNMFHRDDQGRAVLPDYILNAIQEALPAFDRQIRGFAMDDAILTGVETRTSSPLRIPRGADGQSPQVLGLYPAGEGAGYAGGIMSAGVDGIEAAEALGRDMLGMPPSPGQRARGAVL